MDCTPLAACSTTAEAVWALHEAVGAQTTEGAAPAAEAPALAKQKEAEIFGLLPMLQDRRGQKASSLSGGQQQMLALDER